MWFICYIDEILSKPTIIVHLMGSEFIQDQKTDQSDHLSLSYTTRTNIFNVLDLHLCS